MKRNLLIAALLIFPLCLLASHKGKVYVDANKNDLYDKGERLLNGVMVTDGLHVVKTDSKGEFELSGHDRARFIAVTTPSGYKAGNTHYIKISDHINAYDFALTRWDTRLSKDGSHRFIQISDTEIFNTTDQERWANNVRDYSQNEAIAFIIHTGDICYENGLEEHIRLMNTKNMGCPMYYCLGNHDLVKGEYGEQLFESIYGPAWFSFDYGNVHYIITPMRDGDYKPSYTEAHVSEWLKNDLAAVGVNTPIIFFNHNLKSYTDEFVYKKNDDEKVVLSDYNLKAWLYGHWHNHFVRMQGKVKTISTATLDKGGIDHSTSAFRVMSVDAKGNVETQLRYTYINNSIKIASIGNENATINNKGQVPLIVNTYNSTSTVSAVSCRLSDENGILSDKLQLKQATDWSWLADINVPEKYKNDQLFVEVTAIFKNGEVAKTKKSFVYQPNDINKVTLGDNWTTLLGNSMHNLYSADPLRPPVKLSWATNIKANLFLSSPLVYDNMVYVAAVDEDLKGEGGIYALNAKSGDLKWKYKTRSSIKNTIAIDNGYVFAQDVEGYLYAIDTKNGKLAWERKLGIHGLPALQDGLTAINGTVYAGSGKGFSAYDAQTGKQKWVNTEWEQEGGTTSTYTANDEVVIASAQWQGMHASDARTGKLLWSLTKNGISDRGSSPVIHNELAYFISSHSVFVVDIKSGNIIVSKKLPYSVDVTSTPLVTDKLIIFGTVDNGLVALDKEDYSEKWKVATLPALVYTAPYTRYPAGTIETSPVRIGDHVVFGASDGIIYLVNMENGKIDWKHETGAPVFSSVAVSGNTFFATDFGGNVYAFSGKEKN